MAIGDLSTVQSPTGIALLIASALTILAVFLPLNFNRGYLRRTGDSSDSYLSPNRWRLLALVLRQHRQPELARLRVRVLVVLALWLVSVIVLLALPIGNGS